MGLPTEGWRIAMFPEPDPGLEILGPDGAVLLTVAPGDPVPASARQGPWPGGSRRETWFRTPSGRRCGASTSIWRYRKWRGKREDLLVPARITVDADWAGGYLWNEYGELAQMESFFAEGSGALALAAPFEEWQSRFEETEPWLGKWEPRGGEIPFLDDGMALCLRLAEWVGPEGYVRFPVPLNYSVMDSSRLVFAWEAV